MFHLQRLRSLAVAADPNTKASYQLENLPRTLAPLCQNDYLLQAPPAMTHCYLKEMSLRNRVAAFMQQEEASSQTEAPSLVTF